MEKGSDGENASIGKEWNLGGDRLSEKNNRTIARLQKAIHKRMILTNRDVRTCATLNTIQVLLSLAMNLYWLFNNWELKLHS